MGLLGDSWDDPKTMATMQLAAGLLGGGNFGQAAGRGLAGYQAQMAAAQEQEMKRQQMQVEKAKAEEYRSRMEGAKATQQRDVQFQQALQQRVPPAELARYFPEKVDLIQKLAGARNFGRDEVARTAEVEGPGGSKVIQGYSKYGDEVGQGANGYVAPQGVNLGGSYTFAKPVAGQSFQITQDPNSIASNAITLRGQNMTDARARERLEMDRANAGDGGKAPAGYRWKPDGTMEAIPGGPADNKVGGAGAKVQDAKDVLGILDMVDPLLKKSTGSYAGAAMDIGAQAFGFSTPGAKAAAELKALQGALISKMPKMTGPQSDKDVQLYREMAGQIGDPTIPAETRAAAVNAVRMLNEKYAGGPTDEKPAAALPANPSANNLTKGQRYTLPNGRVGVWDGMGFKAE